MLSSVILAWLQQKEKMLSTNNLDPAFVSCSINNNCYGLFNLCFFFFLKLNFNY